ncbi:hypothetical protein DFJ73DRAFT_613043, partial [Zopfochytrium polystomum]
DGTLCLTATRDASNPYFITLTVESGLGGWVAVGLGANMTKTTMYVGWESSAGTMMVSQRFALGHGIPSLSPTQTFDLVDTPPGVAILASTNLAFTVRLPASGVERFNVSESGPTSFILGSSSWPPLFRDSPTAKFTRHEARGPLQLDLSFPADQTSAAPSASSSAVVTAAARARALRRAHGACMTAAWAGVPPAAVFLARYMKSRLGHLWFRAHVALFVYVAGGLTVAGLACIEAEVARWGGTAPGTALVNSPHGAVGAVLAVALFPLQIALGAASNWLWSPDRSAVPWWDRLHWWVGRLASLWGLVAIVMGVLEY